MHINALPSPIPTSATTPTTTARTADTVPRDGAGDLTQPPQPPRFPWLNWQSRLQVEGADAPRTVFPDAPVIGDQLDEVA